MIHILIRRRGLRNIGFLHQNHLKGKKFIIYGPSDSGKLTFIKKFCSQYETIIVFCFDEEERDVRNTHGVNDLHLFNNLENFANNKIAPNLEILCFLAIRLICIYATNNIINLPTKNDM